MIPDKNECVIPDNIYSSNEIINGIESSIIFNNDIDYNDNNSKSSTIIETEDIIEYLEIMSIIKNLMNILNNDEIKKTASEEILYYDKLIYYIEIHFTLKYFNTTKIDEGKEQ